MNTVFFTIIALAFGFAVFNNAPAAIGQAALDSAKGAVELALGLVGYMALFLGLMKIVEEAGGLRFMARLIQPVMRRLFPEIPADHPAFGAMTMNISANILGLGNAATPFGIKAMKELDRLNPTPGAATDAMVLFLAINTSGLALLPTGIIGLRAGLGSTDAAAIFPTTLIATAFSTLIGIIAAKLLSRSRRFRIPSESCTRHPEPIDASRSRFAEFGPSLAFVAILAGLVSTVFVYGKAASDWIIPVLIFGILMLGMVRRIKVYEVFVSGAKEGFQLAVTIIPYLVAILVAVGMFRQSGGLDLIVGAIGQITSQFGLPAEVLPLALLRPLSGSGSFGITAELLQTYGPDSYIGLLASTMNGSTETTFYVLAVYFGSVGVTRIRHAVLAGLAADLAGVIGAVIAVNLLLV